MPAATTEFVNVDVLLQGPPAQKFEFGAVLGAFTHTVTVNRQDGPFFSIEEVNAAGFTAAAAPTINAWASSVFAQQRGVDSLVIGRIDAADPTLTDSLDAIEAADSGSWYITNIESRTDADILELAAWTEPRSKISVAQSASADLLAGTPGNIGEQLQALGYNRTALLYHALDAEYADGAWSSVGGGFDLDGPSGVGTWFGKTLAGITFDSVSAAEAQNIFDVNANLFGRNLGLQFVSKGTMASGRFIDVQTTIDWVQQRLEESILSLLVGTPTKIPYTDAGIALVGNSAQSVLDLGVTAGHFTEDGVNGPPSVTLPLRRNISNALIQTRTLQFTAQATIAGAIQKVELTLNVSFV